MVSSTRGPKVGAGARGKASRPGVSRSGFLKSKEDNGSPVMMTYVVTYDRPLRRRALEAGDKYIGLKIKNWHLKRKSSEILLPETVPPRAEIKSEDVEERPHGRRPHFMPSIQHTGDVAYDQDVVLESYGPSGGGMKASRSPESKVPIPVLHLSTAEGPTVSREKNQLQTSEPRYVINNKPSKKKPADDAQLVGSADTAQSITYVVNTDFNNRPKDTEGKFGISGMKKVTKLPVSKDEAPKITAMEVADIQPQPLSPEARPLKGNYEVGGRTAEASMVIPESTSLEFPLSMPVEASTPKSSGNEVITYHVTHDHPRRHREWDIKIKRKSPKTKNITTSAASKKNVGKRHPAPVTVTYRVTHSPPQSRKQWKTPRIKKTGAYNVTAKVRHPEKIPQHVDVEDREVRELELEPGSSTFRYPEADITADIDPQASAETPDTKKFRGEIGIDMPQLELRPWVSSVRMPEGAEIHKKKKEKSTDATLR